MTDQDEREYWAEVVQYLKETQKKFPIVLFYSSREGWANVSYKTERVKITSSDCWHDMTEKIKSLTNDRQPKRPR